MNGLYVTGSTSMLRSQDVFAPIYRHWEIMLILNHKDRGVLLVSSGARLPSNTSTPRYVLAARHATHWAQSIIQRCCG